jgi:hypothetical protein
MMRVDHVRTRDRCYKTRRDGVGRVSPQPADRPQRAPPNSVGLQLDVCPPPKADQLALDVRRQGACQLERIALAAPE